MTLKPETIWIVQQEHKSFLTVWKGENADLAVTDSSTSGG